MSPAIALILGLLADPNVQSVLLGAGSGLLGGWYAHRRAAGKPVLLPGLANLPNAQPAPVAPPVIEPTKPVVTPVLAPQVPSVNLGPLVPLIEQIVTELLSQKLSELSSPKVQK